MIIYKITNKINGKIYIGQTVLSVRRRWTQHTTSAKVHPLYAAFAKYGLSNFSIEEVCSALDKKYLNDLEKYFISFYSCLSPNGYNLTTGGDSAFSRSEETKKKQSEAMMGHTVSEETRRKISESLTGRPGNRKGALHSMETRRKIGEVQRGRKLSEETRRKMSESHRNRLEKDGTRSPAQLEALKKMQESCKGRVPWNKGKKKETLND